MSRLLSECVSLPLAGDEVKDAWAEIARLFAQMRAKLGAPLSLQTVLLHHFYSREGVLHEPRLMPAKDLDRLRVSAITDPLTGLYNRRFLSDKLSRHLFRATRSGDPLSVAILDLKDFKSINDRFGHRAGDRALALTAGVIRASLRPGDTPCRWGGDEFVVVLPEADCLSAVTIAERIRRRIILESASFRAGMSLDLYYGVASFPFDGRTANRLLAVADARLYQCREQWGFDGGNRRRYPRFAIDRMRLKMPGGAGFDAPVVNVSYGGLAFQASRQENVPPRTDAELSRPADDSPRVVRIRVTHADRLPGGRVRVGCKYA